MTDFNGKQEDIGTKMETRASNLPVELVRLIVVQVSRNNPARGAMLSRCCKTFYEWCIPELYRCIFITKDHQYLALKHTLQHKPQYAAFIETIVLQICLSPADYRDLLYLCHPSQQIITLRPLIPPYNPDGLPGPFLPPEVICFGSHFPHGVDWTKVKYIYLQRILWARLWIVASQWKSLKYLVCTSHEADELRRIILCLQRMEKIVGHMPPVLILFTGNGMNEFWEEHPALKHHSIQVLYFSFEDHISFWKSVSEGKTGVQELLRHVLVQ